MTLVIGATTIGAKIVGVTGDGAKMIGLVGRRMNGVVGIKYLTRRRRNTTVEGARTKKGVSGRKTVTNRQTRKPNSMSGATKKVAHMNRRRGVARVRTMGQSGVVAPESTGTGSPIGIGMTGETENGMSGAGPRSMIPKIGLTQRTAVGMATTGPKRHPAARSRSGARTLGMEKVHEANLEEAGGSTMPMRLSKGRVGGPDRTEVVERRRRRAMPRKKEEEPMRKKAPAKPQRGEAEKVRTRQTRIPRNQPVRLWTADLS
mmetsp:Transcript_142380/g.248294  ORF Transcript_142380/g.248294 Transcript_142380/m.248294 type:complete len:260 (+) Transcript_142380:2883-3662(+)